MPPARIARAVTPPVDTEEEVSGCHKHELVEAAAKYSMRMGAAALAAVIYTRLLLTAAAGLQITPSLGVVPWKGPAASV